MSEPSSVERPLFPLRTVLYPDGLLELKIFEARYLDLVSRCLREGAPFGVVALKSGAEAGRSTDAVSLHATGTLAELIDVDAQAAGILRVRCRGTRRFALGQTRCAADGLWLGEASEVEPDPVVAPLPEHDALVESLRSAIASLAAQDTAPFLEPHRFDDAGWLANRWCEILPLPLEAKVVLLALPDPLARLGIVDRLLQQRQSSERPH